MRISKELNRSEVIPTEEEKEEYVSSTKDKGGVERIFIELHREEQGKLRKGCSNRLDMKIKEVTRRWGQEGVLINRENSGRIGQEVSSVHFVRLKAEATTRDNHNNRERTNEQQSK